VYTVAYIFSGDVSAQLLHKNSNNSEFFILCFFKPQQDLKKYTPLNI
jgi:hypothetical protein